VLLRSPPPPAPNHETNRTNPSPSLARRYVERARQEEMYRTAAPAVSTHDNIFPPQVAPYGDALPRQPTNSYARGSESGRGGDGGGGRRSSGGHGRAQLVRAPRNNNLSLRNPLTLSPFAGTGSTRPSSTAPSSGSGGGRRRTEK
jgi:hypothetical protein